MASKRLSTDDDDEDEDDYEEEEDDETHGQECRKRLKIVTKKQKPNETPSLAPTQFGIFIQCNGPVSCNIFSTNENLSSSTTTTTTTTMTNTPGSDSPSANLPKTEPDFGMKSAASKKSSEGETPSRSYFEKQTYSNVSRSNSTNEQTSVKSNGNNRLDSYRYVSQASSAAFLGFLCSTTDERRDFVSILINVNLII